MLSFLCNSLIIKPLHVLFLDDININLLKYLQIIYWQVK